MNDRAALRAVAVASAGVASAALVAAAVRVLPWMLDPAVPRQAAAPFARTLATLALEVALLVGWPVGWALATQQLVERGEARALAALGERPARTLARLAPQGLVFLALLAATSLFGGRDAREPGRVVRELVAQTRAACASATHATAYAVPFVDATWLCVPHREPRLVGRGPGALGAVVYTAANAAVSDDLRRIELEDAHLALPRASGEKRLFLHAHVGKLTMRGLPPWAQSALLTPAARAALMCATGALAAAIAVLSLLRTASSRPLGRLASVVLGASGPLAALAAMRALERADARPWLFVLVPVTAAAGSSLAALLFARVPRRRGESSRGASET